jgi:hypothetical protein
MLNSQRYRDYALQCLAAADDSAESHVRGLQLALAAAWIELANQDEAASKLFASWRTPDISATNSRTQFERMCR